MLEARRLSPNREGWGELELCASMCHAHPEGVKRFRTHIISLWEEQGQAFRMTP